MTVYPRVIGARALLKPLEANEATSSGIVIPDEVRDQEARALVVAVGTPPIGETEAPVAVGDVVVYAPAGTRAYAAPAAVTIDTEEKGTQEKLVVLEYADILLVLEDEPAEAWRDPEKLSP